MDILAEYVKQGFALVPIPAGEKGPKHKEWNLPNNAIKSLDDVDRITGNVGILHSLCKEPTACFDIDNLNQAKRTLKDEGIDIDELLKLHGVGRKTANIVIVFGFHKDGMPIDTHCHRIPNRLGWIKTKTPEETEIKLRELMPRKYWQDFNDIFVAYGQNVCVPISPFCSKCVIRKYCKRVGVGRSR